MCLFVFACFAENVCVVYVDYCLMVDGVLFCLCVFVRLSVWFRSCVCVLFVMFCVVLYGLCLCVVCTFVSDLC